MRAQDVPPHLHDRYGIHPPSPWRLVAWGAAAVIALPVLGYAGLRYAASQNRPYALIQWSANAAHSQVSVTFHATQADHVRWCAIRAQAFDHYDVGYAVVPVRKGVTAMTVQLAVVSEPTAVDVVDCGRDPYALPGAQFPPGVQGPAQRAPAIAPGVVTTQALQALL